MPYIVAKSSDQSEGSTASLVILLPATAAANDVIALCLTNDGGGTTIAATGYSGPTQAANQGVRQAWLFKVAEGGETSVTVTGANDEWCYTCYIIRGADVSGTPWVASTRQDWATAKTIDSIAFDATSAGNHSLLFYSWGHDTTTTQTNIFWTNPGDLEVDGSIANTTAGIHHICGHRTLHTAGNAPTVTCYPSQDTDGGNGWVIAIKDANAGTNIPYAQYFYRDWLDLIHMGGNVGRFLFQEAAGLSTFTATGDAATDVLTATGWTPVDGTQIYARAITGGGGLVVTLRYIVINSSGSTFQLTTTLLAGGTYGAAVNFTTNITSSTWVIQTQTIERPTSIAASINGITCEDRSAAYGIAGSIPGLSVTGDGINGINSSIGSESWCGQVIAFSASKDLSGDRLFTLDWATSTGWTGVAFSADGAIIVFSDGTNWKAFQLAAKASAKNSERSLSVIDLQNGTSYASSGTINWAAVTKIGFFNNRANTATPPGIVVRCLAMVKKGIISGGCSANPVNGYALFSAVENNAPFTHLLSSSGITQSIDRFSYQIGNGSFPTYWDSSTGSQENPNSYLASDIIRKRWNVPSALTAIDLYTSAYDTFLAQSAIFAGRNNQKFVVNASANLSATISMSAATFAGKTVVNDANRNWSSVTFRNCTQVDGGTGTFTDATFVGSTGATALKLEAGGDAISCAFTKGSDTYAIELTAAGSYDLSNTTFSGYTKPLNVTATSGTVTISLARGQSVPTYDTAGATVVFSQPQNTATVTGIVSGSRIQVYNITTDTEIANEIVSGTTWTKDYTEGSDFTSGDVVRIRLACCSGTSACEPFETSAVATSSSVSTLALQTSSTVYNTWAIDGSAQSQYSADGTHIDIDVTSPGSYTKKSIAAWWMCHLTTEGGIRDFWGAYTLESVNSIRQNVSVVDVLLENTTDDSAVIFTDNDVRYYRSDYSLPYDTTAGSGAFYMDYAGVPLLVETGVSGLTSSESAKLMAIPSNPVLTSDGRLNYLDASVSSRPTAAANASAVRAELATELSRVDAAVSTRLASASYTTPPTAAANATAVLDATVEGSLSTQDVLQATLAVLAGDKVLAGNVHRFKNRSGNVIVTGDVDEYGQRTSTTVTP